MDSWRSVSVPVLPGDVGQRVELRDPVTGRSFPVGPSAGRARIYACGITPYDAAHLGHAFTYLGVDLLVRTWMDAGLDVDYVQNVTDVDDPLLERAAATGQDWRELAATQINLFRSDMQALRIVPPARLHGVVESMDAVTAAIERLRDRQGIYQLSDAEYPDWYFAINDPDRLLSGTGIPPGQAEQVFAERGGDPARVGKRGRFDCLVWRVPRIGEPSWASALGEGRPGWHVECAAIAVQELGGTIDVQAGGRDLAFPHHPMSAAAAQELSGQPFTKATMHVGMVGFGGAKMSKSLGNLVFVHQLTRDGADPMAIRLMLLAQHYRPDWEYTPELLEAAEARLVRWRKAVTRRVGPPARGLIEQVRMALRSDLDAPAALALVDQWAVESGTDSAAPAEVSRLVDALLGVEL